MEETEVLLKHTLESLEFALESGRMGTWDFDIESGFISCSREMLDLWGIDPQEFKNERQLLQSKVHPDDIHLMNHAINTAIKTRNVYELEYRIIPFPGKERWVQSRGRCTFALGSNQPVRFAGVVYDITEKKEKEQKLANALKARHEFFTIASHELKTPLTVMQPQIQIMQWLANQFNSGDFSPDVFKDSLIKQQEQLLRISRIVDNILDESKISEGRLSLQLEQFDLSEVAISVIGQIKLTASQYKVEIILTSLERVIGNWDRFRLEQVLVNLLMNAIRYGNKKTIEVEVKAHESKALIIVRDQGIGIRAEDHVRIFEKFERANPETERNGMGLGLFISKNIVLAHKGEILVKSEINQGSEFTVVLPRL